MRAGRSSPNGPVRRVEHAHRIRQPIGPGDVRRRPARRRPGRRFRPGPASLLGIVAIALVALVLRPLGFLDDAAGARRSGDVAGLTAGPRGVDAASTPAALGPHGDLVAAAARNDDIARWRDARMARGGGAPWQPLLRGYQWPTKDARITNTYGLDRPGSFLLGGVTFHDGIDVSSFCGARITAAHDGIVLGSGRHTEGLLGWVGDLTAFRARVDADQAWGGQAITVVVDDGNGYRSIYAHLGVAVAKRGDVVKAGDLLGYEGASGNATGCHLHFAIFDPGERATLTLDPKIAKKTMLPPLEVARINPLLVLPPLSEASITWNWGAR